MGKLGIYPGDWAGDVSNDGGNFGERPWVARRGDGFRKGLNPSYALRAQFIFDASKSLR
jgi:hypothetical protein